VRDHVGKQVDVTINIEPVTALVRLEFADPVSGHVDYDDERVIGDFVRRHLSAGDVADPQGNAAAGLRPTRTGADSLKLFGLLKQTSARTVRIATLPLRAHRTRRSVSLYPGVGVGG